METFILVVLFIGTFMWISQLEDRVKKLKARVRQLEADQQDLQGDEVRQI